jgi:hypothetical protein
VRALTDAGDERRDAATRLHESTAAEQVICARAAFFADERFVSPFYYRAALPVLICMTPPAVASLRLLGLQTLHLFG